MDHTNSRNHPGNAQARKMSLERSLNSRWRWFSVPAFITAAYALNASLGFIQLGDTAMLDRIRSSYFGSSHMMGGLIAIALGPFQFITSLRKRNPLLHVWAGRIYTGAVMVSGISAFRVSFTSMCRPLGQYGFALLASAWLITAAKGMGEIWAGRITLHRQWMARNFALTYAAVMLRWQLMLYVALGLKIEPALSLTGWTCWIPNLIFIEWQIRCNPSILEY